MLYLYKKTPTHNLFTLSSLPLPAYALSLFLLHNPPPAIISSPPAINHHPTQFPPLTGVHLVTHTP
ncbi:hypothetical protein Hanom_Chr09g00779691 [Helianthus anomalus]